MTPVYHRIYRVSIHRICAAARNMRGCRGWWMPTAWTYTAEGDDLCSCSIFTVPVLNAKKAIDHYTVYGGTLLIRNDADGRSYLYDLLDVQKKKVISAPSFSATAARHSEVFAPKPSADSIHTSDGNVNTEKLSTGRSIDEMAGEDADTWRGVDTGRVTQENGLFRRDAGRPTHIKRACGIASQTLLLYMYDAILRRRLTSRRRCRSDRPCCRCSGPDSRRWYSAPPPWARPRPRSRSGASPWCHRRT